MGENKITNLFEIALEKRELDKFLLGLGSYFLRDPESGEHWPLGSYKNLIIVSIENNPFPKIFWEQVYELLINAQDINILLDNLVAYLIPYYNSSDENHKIQRTTLTPEINIQQIRDALKTNKESLIKDNRGTGVEWNSKTGLWGGITGNLLVIKKRGGPNFLPDEFI